MTERRGAAVAHPNIALIKYWGNRDHDLRLPSNSSISMTLAGLESRTHITFSSSLERDEFELNGKTAQDAARHRVSTHLDHLRHLAGSSEHAFVKSANSFPAGTGIASSAAGFAALTVAACQALDLPLDPGNLSRLARRGSGSACRSLFGGFVQWLAADHDEDSFAEPIAPADHWPLRDVIAIVSTDEKAVGSTRGHELAPTSPLQQARLAHTPSRLERCRRAIMERDFGALAQLVELDSDMMHAVMMTSTPPLLYWQPTTVAVMHEIRRLRSEGLPLCYTLDAGPNVHCLTPAEHAGRVEAALSEINGVRRLITSAPGGPATPLPKSARRGG